MECKDGWTEFEGFCYQFRADKNGLKVAELDCILGGGHVVSIHSERENTFVRGKLWLWKKITLEKSILKVCERLPFFSTTRWRFYTRN